jgi:hypothetical protein
MAKRFIDTKMFEDEWICSLSKDAKLFFIYYITTCDHAGILKLNKKLCEFQTGLKNTDTVIKELGKSLITVKENVYFMPRFIKFQYPDFPKSTVKQQDSALKILKSYNLFNDETNSYLTLSKELPNSYDSDNDIDSDSDSNNVNVINKNKYEFVKIEFKQSFEKWIAYKKERKESYKSEMSLKTFYDNLIKLSNNNPDIAMQIVNQSIANNWAGIFELKQPKQPTLNKANNGMVY